MTTETPKKAFKTEEERRQYMAAYMAGYRAKKQKTETEIRKARRSVSAILSDVVSAGGDAEKTAAALQKCAAAIADLIPSPTSLQATQPAMSNKKQGDMKRQGEIHAEMATRGRDCTYRAEVVKTANNVTSVNNQAEKTTGGIPRMGGGGDNAMDDDMFKKGMAARKATLGEKYVEDSFAAADQLNRPFQEAMTAWCWGFGWGDPAIDPKTRSLLNLALIGALGKMQEWELHCRGAVRNGASMEEIRAVIHIVGIYAGVPQALECFRAARKVLEENKMI